MIKTQSSLLPFLGGAAAIPVAGFASGALLPSKTVRGEPSSRLTAERGQMLGGVAGGALTVAALLHARKNPRAWDGVARQAGLSSADQVVGIPLRELLAAAGGVHAGAVAGGLSSRIGARIPEADRRRGTKMSARVSGGDVPPDVRAYLARNPGHMYESPVHDVSDDSLVGHITMQLDPARTRSERRELMGRGGIYGGATGVLGGLLAGAQFARPGRAARALGVGATTGGALGALIGAGIGRDRAQPVFQYDWRDADPEAEAAIAAAALGKTSATHAAATSVGLLKISVTAAQLQQAMNRAYPRVRLPRKMGTGVAWGETSVLQQGVRAQGGKGTMFAAPLMKDPRRAAGTEAIAAQQGVSPYSLQRGRVYAGRGQPMSGFNKAFERQTGTDIGEPLRTGADRRALGAVIHRHEAAEIAAGNKQRGTAAIFSHWDPSVLTTESNTLAALQGPGSGAAREYMRAIRSLQGEDAAYERMVRRVTGGRGDYHRFGEKKLPKAMRKRVDAEWRKAVREEVRTLGLSPEQLAAYGW